MKSVSKPASRLFTFFALFFLSCTPDEIPVQPDQIGPATEYETIAEKLTTAINYEMSDKDLPAFAIVLVDDQQTVWAKSFGYENPQEEKKADLNTIYRIGSVSKLFT